MRHPDRAFRPLAQRVADQVAKRRADGTAAAVEVVAAPEPHGSRPAGRPQRVLGEQRVGVVRIEPDEDTG